MARHSFLYLVAIVAALATGGLAGCSGAQEQDVLASGSSSSSSTSSGGGASSSGSGDAKDGGNSSSGGNAKECTPEEEPNDEEDEANVLEPERCGTLSSDDGIDYLTFALKPTTKTMSIHFAGRVRLRVDVKGEKSTELTPDSTGIVPFVPRGTYFIAVTPLTDTKSELPWRVTIVEE